MRYWRLGAQDKKTGESLNLDLHITRLLSEDAESRYAHALAQGLRAAGWNTELTIVEEVARPA